MAKFEKVSRFKDVEFNLPVRKTKRSAGYDFEVAEDVKVQTYKNQMIALDKFYNRLAEKPTLAEVGRFTKEVGARPTLVSTGVKCKLDGDEYLELSVRSSTPLKYWMVLANGEGIIDADYYDNQDNEGEIFFQVINFGPKPIYLKKGDIIGQGIIHKYGVTEDDKAEGERTGGLGSTTKEKKGKK